MRILPLFCSLLVLAAAARAGEFQIAEGDRVAFIGNTFVERDQNTGYFETLLASRFAGQNILLRNMGWSGDNLRGESRAGFGKPQDGFNHLVKLVAEFKPTKILLAYGMSESFDGPAGLQEYLKNFENMLNMLEKHSSKIAIISPIKHEKLPPPLPDPAAHNAHLRLYIDATRALAEKRGFHFVDLYALLGDGTGTTPAFPITDNGIHLTNYGYFRAGLALEKGLGYAPRNWALDVDIKGNTATAKGAKVVKAQTGAERVSVNVQSDVLPVVCATQPGSPAELSQTPAVLKITGLSAGQYTLKVDSVAVAKASAAELAQGVRIGAGAEFAQSEKLRTVIAEKNQLFFHRWRPQNETYIFGFRKREQGRNAVEIPQFDPFIAEKEVQIKKLSVPEAHTYVVEKE